MVTWPNLLSCARLFLVPVLLTLAWNGNSRVFFFCLVISMLTDSADGFLARRLNQATDLGAKLDSWADFITCLALPFCAWWLRPDVIREQAFYLGAGIFFYLAATVVGFLKFKVLTSYHTWGAKLSALLLAAGALLIFAGGPGWVFRFIIPIVVLTSIEEIAITIILRELQSNIPSLWHALRLRKRAIP